MTEHRDLDEASRYTVVMVVEGIVEGLHASNQSLAIAREAMIDAFDAEAARLAGEG